METLQLLKKQDNFCPAGSPSLSVQRHYLNGSVFVFFCSKIHLKAGLPNKRQIAPKT